MKKFLTPMLMLSVCAAFAQTVNHHSYTTHYNASLKEADSVSWNLNSNMVGCGGIRIDRFAEDPAIAGSAKPTDYLNSGYDKGHLFPYKDAECSETDKVECFYMSNMVPQLHALNAGDWKTLETQERVWAKTQSIRIIAGGFGSKGKLASGENIPESCWKAIYVDHHWICWVMPNENSSVGHAYGTWIVHDISRFNAITKLHLR